MPSDKVHVAELCSRLYGFQYIKDDTDVTIFCEGQQFLCHRSVLAPRSAYFECMLKNIWTENVARYVTFDGDHMKRDTLVEVLKYLYAGNASITSSNIVDLLYAGDYLGLLGLEAYCIRILPQVEPERIVDRLWEALFSPHSVFNQSLISVLASCNLTKRLKEIFETNEFLRISADHFVIIVTKLWKSPPTMNGILLSAIYRWRAYALNERKEQAQKLHKLLEPALENSLKLCVISLESFSRVNSNRETTVAAPQCPSLYVYARNTPFIRNEDIGMKTYRYSCEDPSDDEKFVAEYSYQQDTLIKCLRFVSVHNVGLFSISTAFEKGCSTPSTFLQFASENIYDFQSGLVLKPPPIDTTVHEYYDLCNLSNRGLYLLDTRYCGIPKRRNHASVQDFTDEEIQRGIYFFNIELDRWLPVPAMVDTAPLSCMTVLDNNMVYVIGGYGYKKIVQAYDHRLRRWQRMPTTLHQHFIPQSCVHDGSIYVTSSEHCERYDPVAAKWEDVASVRNDDMDSRRLLSYKHELWHFRSSSGTYSMEVYNPRTTTWSTIESRLSASILEDILDAVIWGETTTTET